jgi:acyl-CoA synthetase (AMP-forming)/AMP-acid ligase II
MINTIKDKQNFQAISDYVYYYAKTQPDAEAMVLNNTRTSYAVMAEKVDEYAQALLVAGIQKGDRVATLCTPSPDFFILFLATASIGAIWVGLNPKYTFDELCYVVEDARPKLILTRTEIKSKNSSRNYIDDLHRLKSKCSSVEQLVSLDEFSDGTLDYTHEQFIAHGKIKNVSDLRGVQDDIVKQDPALLVYTSGTTGAPKGGLLPHGGLISCCETQNHIFECSNMKFVNFLPINHIGCVGDISCSTLVSGGTIIFLEQFEADACLKLMSDEKVTVWGGIPTTFLLCLSDPYFADYDLSSIELILWSGAAASKDLVVTLAKIHPRLANCYGQTETVGSISFVPPCSDIDLLVNTVGKPPEHYDVKLLDKNGQEVADDEVGEIVVKGDFIMNGYWNRPEETAKIIDQDGYMHTGDLAKRRADGYLSLVGRTKEMFKSGGYNVYPREIEIVMENYPGVDMAALVAMNDPIFGEVGHAFILVSSNNVDEKSLMKHCRESLANYKIPKSFIITLELPMLPIGKVDKKALKQRLIESSVNI